MIPFFIDRGPELRRRILLAVVFGVPVLFLRFVNDPINVPKLALLVIGVSIVATIRVIEILGKRPISTLRVLAVPAIAILIPLVIAWVASPYRSWALFGEYQRFQGVLPYVFVVLLAVLVADTFAGEPVPVVWALFAAGGVVGGYALIQWLGLDPFEWSIKGGRSDAATSTLGNENFTGGFLGAILPLAAGLFMSQTPRRGVIAGVSVLVCGGWIVSFSQAGWAAGLAGLIVVGGVVLAVRRPWIRVAALVMAGLMAAAVAGTVVIAMIDPDHAIVATVGRRADWWEASLDMGTDRPAIGHGPNAFAIDHARYRTLSDAQQVNFDITDDPHSIFLSFWSSAGALGVIGLALLLTWVIRTGLRVGSGDAVAGALFGAAVAYFIQALVSVDTIALRTLLWSLVGGLAATGLQRPAALRPRKKRSKGRRSEFNWGPVAAVACLVVGVFGSWLGTRLLAADWAYARAQRSFAAGDVNEAEDRFESALRWRSDVAYRRGYAGRAGEVVSLLVREGRPELAEPYLAKARDLLSYTETLPHSNSIVDWARILRLSEAVQPGSGEEALDEYGRAVLIDRFNSVLLHEAVDHAMNLARYEEAIAFLRPTVTEIGSASLWGKLAMSHAFLGDTQGAEEAIEEALELDPNDPFAVQAQELLARSS